MTLDIITRQEVEDAEVDIEQSAWNLIELILQCPMVLSTVKHVLTQQADTSTLRELAMFYVKNGTLDPDNFPEATDQLAALGFEFKE